MFNSPSMKKHANPFTLFRVHSIWRMLLCYAMLLKTYRNACRNIFHTLEYDS